MPVWKTTGVDETPVIEIVRWTVVEVLLPGATEATRHIYGYNMTEQEGRVSSPIVSFDKENKTAVTRSGRQYKLVGDSGDDKDASYVFMRWMKLSNVDSYTDVSSEYS